MSVIAQEAAATRLAAATHLAQEEIVLEIARVWIVVVMNVLTVHVFSKIHIPTARAVALVLNVITPNACPSRNVPQAQDAPQRQT